MKYVFDSRTLNNDTPPPSKVSRERGEPDFRGTPSRDMKDGWWKGAWLRLSIVVGFASLMLFFFARRTFYSLLVGAVTLAFQLMMVELIFGILLKRGRMNPSNERAADRCCRLAKIAWCVDIAIGVVVLAAFVVQMFGTK